MSEYDTDPNEAAAGGLPRPGPPVAPGADSSEPDRATREAEEAEDWEGGPIPGEDPEDNPDLEGEERFDAG